jgi:hypothetical protein
MKYAFPVDKALPASPFPGGTAAGLALRIGVS